MNFCMIRYKHKFDDMNFSVIKKIGFCLFALCAVYASKAYANSTIGVIGDEFNDEYFLVSDGPQPILKLDSIEDLTDIAVSADGETVAVLGETKLEIYNLSNLQSDGISKGGSHIAFHPDGRRVFVASGRTVFSYNIYPEAEFAESSLSPAFTLVREYSVEEYDIVALSIRPDGEFLYVATEGQLPDAYVENDLLNRGRDNSGDNIDSLTEASIRIARIEVSGEVVSREDYVEPVFKYSEPLSDLYLHGVSDMDLSPDGNYAIVTMRGIQVPTATPFGVIPTPDDLTGGVLVYDLNTLTLLDYIPSSLAGEDTAEKRLAIEIIGRKTTAPSVDVAASIAGTASAFQDVVQTSSLATNFLNPNVTPYAIAAQQAWELLSDSFKDYGVMQAYAESFPTDMVGPSGVGISGFNDMAIVSMTDTNNFGFIPLIESDAVRGFGPGSIVNFDFSKATEKTVNGLGTDVVSSIIDANDPREYLAPREVAFGPNDTFALLGMSGGIPGGKDNFVGLVDVQTYRPEILSGENNPSYDFLALLNPGFFDRPMQVDAFREIDLDGDGISNYAESFNRWNSYKDIQFGDATQLVSTNRFNISSPTRAQQIRTYPVDLSDQGFALPHSGLGYRFNYSGHTKHSVNASSMTTVATLERVGREWHRKFIDEEVSRPYFIVLDLNHPGGGRVVNKDGEYLHFQARNGYQANLAYLSASHDNSVDFVLSNSPLDPLNNTEVGGRDFDSDTTRVLIDLLVAEDTVSRIILDPAAADAMGVAAYPKVETHGLLDSTIPSRRDHDAFFRVEFQDTAGVSINIDQSYVIEQDIVNGADTFSTLVVQTGRENNTAFPVSINIQNPSVDEIVVDTIDLFYDQELTLPVLDGRVDAASLNTLLWTPNNDTEFGVTTFSIPSSSSDGVILDFITIKPLVTTFEVTPEYSTVQVTESDSDSDQIPDFADGFDLDGSSQLDRDRDLIRDVDDDRTSLTFSEISINTEIPGEITSGGGPPVIRISYEASAPSAVSKTTTIKGADRSRVETVFSLPDSGALRLWKLDGSAERSSSDFIAPGVHLLENIPESIYVELVADATELEIIFELDPDGFEGPVGFVGKQSVYINSAGESSIEPNFLFVNETRGDSGLAGYFDLTGDHGLGSLEFALPPGLDNAREIALEYSASDPNGMSYSQGVGALPAGNLRLWRTQTRSTYLAPERYASLPPTIYAEGIRPSASFIDQRVTFSTQSLSVSTGINGFESIGDPAAAYPFGFIAVNETIPSYISRVSVDLTVYPLPALDLFAPDAEFRKYDLYGRPLTAIDPYLKQEIDRLDNGMSVDSFSLIPTISRSDISVPLIGANLSMELRRTASLDTYLTEGVDPVEPFGPDRILGLGWRTSIGSRAVVRNGIVSIYDMNGQRHRFTTAGVPVPLSFMETSAHQMDIVINEDEEHPDIIDSIVCTENYWIETYYQQYAPNPSDFNQPLVGQYLRLKYVKDKNGNGIEYLYADDSKSYPSESREVVFDGFSWNIKTGFEALENKKITFSYVTTANGLRLSSAVDPRGNVVSYEYFADGTLKKVSYPTPGGSETFAYTSQRVAEFGNGGEIWQTILSQYVNQDGITCDLSYQLVDYPWSPEDLSLRYLALASVNCEERESLYSLAENTALERKVNITDARGTISSITFGCALTASSFSGSSGSGLNGFQTPALVSMVRTIDDATWECLFSSDTQYNLLSHTDPSGLEFSYQYESTDQVTAFEAKRFKRPLSRTRSGVNDQLVEQKFFDPSSRQMVERTLPRSSDEDADLFTIAYEYDADNRNVVKASRKYRDVDDVLYDWVEIYQYDENFGYLKHYVDADGRVHTFEIRVGDSGWEMVKTLSNGFTDDATYYTETLVYDWHGNLLESNVSGKSDASAVITHEYDAYNNRVSTTLADGSTITRSFDPSGRLKTETDPISTVSTYGYDDRGFLTSITTGPITRSYAYDDLGNLITETDPNGNETTYTYDPLNRMTQERRVNAITNPFGTSASESITSYDFSSDIGSNFFTTDRWHTDSMTDPLDTVTAYTYSEVYFLAGYVQTDINDTRKEESYAYDQHGNITQVSIIGSQHNYATTEITYDAFDREILRTVGDIIHKTYYDFSGNIVASVDGENYVKQYQYDDKSHVIATLEYDTPTTSPNFKQIGAYAFGIEDDDAFGLYTTHTVDGLGRVVQTAVSDGSKTITTIYTVGQRGELLAKTEGFGSPAARSFQYTYDGNLNRLTDRIQVDGQWLTKTYTYDALNRLKELEFPDDTATQLFSYDNNGNITEETRPNSTTVTHTYDGFNNQMTSVAGTGSDAITSYFTYDANGNVTTEGIDAADQITYIFDGFNRPTQVTNSLGHKTTYTYDVLDNLLTTTDAEGRVVTHEYDVNGRIDRTRLPELITAMEGAYSGVPTLSYTYDKRNLLLTAKEDASGEQHTYTYDGLGYTKSYKNPLGDTSQTTHDRFGNLVSRTDFKGSASTYTYDGLNRLGTSTDRAGHTTTYIYDETDNLLEVQHPSGGTDKFAYNSLNLLVSEHRRDIATPRTYEYTPTGALTKVTDENELTTTFTLDQHDRVIVSTDGAGFNTGLTYDPSGNVLTVTDPLNRITTYA